MKILKADEYIGEKLEIEPVSKERLGKYIHKEYEDAGLTDEQAKEFIAKQKLTYNPITKCYDSEHSVFIDNKIIAKDGDGFKINFLCLNHSKAHQRKSEATSTVQTARH